MKKEYVHVVGNLRNFLYLKEINEEKMGIRHGVKNVSVKIRVKEQRKIVQKQI